jgi:hypothetical protein
MIRITLVDLLIEMNRTANLGTFSATAMSNSDNMT